MEISSRPKRSRKVIDRFKPTGLMNYEKTKTCRIRRKDRFRKQGEKENNSMRRQKELNHYSLSRPGQFLATLNIRDETCEMLLDPGTASKSLHSEREFSGDLEMVDIEMPDIHHSVICQTFSSFLFNGWSVDKEEDPKDEYSQNSSNAEGGDENVSDHFTDDTDHEPIIPLESVPEAEKMVPINIGSFQANYQSLEKIHVDASVKEVKNDKVNSVDNNKIVGKAPRVPIASKPLRRKKTVPTNVHSTQIHDNLTTKSTNGVKDISHPGENNENIKNKIDQILETAVQKHVSVNPPAKSSATTHNKFGSNNVQKKKENSSLSSTTPQNNSGTNNVRMKENPIGPNNAQQMKAKPSMSSVGSNNMQQMKAKQSLSSITTQNNAGPNNVQQTRTKPSLSPIPPQNNSGTNNVQQLKAKQSLSSMTPQNNAQQIKSKPSLSAITPQNKIGQNNVQQMKANSNLSSITPQNNAGTNNVQQTKPSDYDDKMGEGESGEKLHETTEAERWREYDHIVAQNWGTHASPPCHGFDRTPSPSPPGTLYCSEMGKERTDSMMEFYPRRLVFDEDNSDVGGTKRVNYKDSCKKLKKRKIPASSIFDDYTPPPDVVKLLEGDVSNSGLGSKQHANGRKYMAKMAPNSIKKPVKRKAVKPDKSDVKKKKPKKIVKKKPKKMSSPTKRDGNEDSDEELNDVFVPDLDELLKVPERPADGSKTADEKCDEMDIIIAAKHKAHLEEMQKVDGDIEKMKRERIEKKARMKENAKRRNKLQKELTESKLKNLFKQNLEYLKGIWDGKVESSRHKAFHHSIRTRHVLFYMIITDPFTDEQLDWTMDEMDKVWGKTEKESMDNNNYIWKVLISECFIKFYMDFFNVRKDEAEEMIKETPLHKRDQLKDMRASDKSEDSESDSN